MTKNSLISTAVTDGVMTFTVGNAGSFDIDTTALAAEIITHAMLHGLKQKVSDGAAIPKSENPTHADKLNAMKSIADRLIAGDWKATAGEGSGPVSGIILRAFSEYVANAAKAKKVAPPTDERIREVYAAKTRSEQLALRNVPEIATIIERIKSEKEPTAKTVDTTALLADLGI